MTPPGLFALSGEIFANAEVQTLPSMTLHLAGSPVMLRFASERVAKVIAPTFRHLQTELAGEPDLIIHVWDAASSPPQQSVPLMHDGAPGYTHFAGKVQCIVDEETGRIEAYDPVRRLGLLYLPDLSRLDPAYAAAPLRNLLHWWAIDRGWLLLHAGCVATDDGAALLVGRGGSGKSTTVLACIGSPLGLLGDDYCLYQPGAPDTVQSLFGTSKIDERAIALLPHLAPAFAGAPADPRGKRIIRVSDHFPGSWRIKAPLRAIIVPKIEPGAGCKAEPVSPAEALRALAPSTIFQLAGGRARALELMAELVRNLPCWRLRIGSDPTAAQQPIAAIIQSAARLT